MAFVKNLCKTQIVLLVIVLLGWEIVLPLWCAKHTLIDYMTNQIKFLLVVCDNRVGFLPFLNYGATEFFSTLRGCTPRLKAWKTLVRARLQSFRTGMKVYRQICRDKCCKYTASRSQCRIQYCKSKIESADRCQPFWPFGLVDGMFRCKPVPLLPSHSSAQDLTERFSAPFIDKITNCDLTYLTVQLPRPLRAIYNIPAVHWQTCFRRSYAKQ